MNVDFASKSREALQKPLHQRCEEIDKLIEGSSTQNLHGFFPQLLSNIFGYSGNTDWGLKTLSRDSREFANVRKFLSPGGTVFKLIDLLQADDQHRYEFFISCLPFPTRASLSEGMIPVLYHDKVPIRTPGETINAVLLNTFEYYMFHFAYYIVYQQAHRQESSVNPAQDYLYLVVLDDYLDFFLPSDGSAVPFNSMKAKTSVGLGRNVPSSRHDSSHYARTHYFQNQFKGLIKPTPGRASPPTTHHGMLNHGSQETWRSETFLQILIEFWLNQNTADSISRNVLSRGQEYFMPTLDHVRVVRILVKHVHSFVYAKGPDMDQLSVLHPYDDLRRAIIPQFLQKKLYHFLQHCFSHWPLDPNFRYVLETWLSYIQPWRYSKVLNATSIEKDDDSRETASPVWKTFVFENLLFYCALLFEFVSRACRFNLCSAKDAQLLFRVLKVFAQPHLVEMVEEGEKAYLMPSGSHRNTPLTSLGTPSSIIKSHIMDLEGPSYSFRSLFHLPGATKMGELHSRVLAALDEVTNKNQSQQSPEDNEGFFAVFMRALKSDMSHGGEFDRNAEEGTLVSYLKKSCEFISKIIRSADSIDGSILNSTIQWETTSPGAVKRNVSLASNQSSLPDHVETDDGPVPTPLGRYQMINGLRKFEVKYSGDPELQPICSYENPALVRLLYKISTHLNEKFGRTLEKTYTTSRLFRSVACYLSPALKTASLPTPSNHPSTSPLHSPQRQLEPQISLRFLASYRTLIYLFMFWLFCRITSLNTLLVVLLWILLLAVMLLYHLRPRYEKNK